MQDTARAWPAGTAVNAAARLDRRPTRNGSFRRSACTADTPFSDEIPTGVVLLDLPRLDTWMITERPRPSLYHHDS